MIRVLGICFSIAAGLPAVGNPRLDFALGVLAESRGHPTQASVCFETALAADPSALPLVRRAVDARMNAGDRPAAVKLYRDLAAARPDELKVQLTYADFLVAQAGGDALAIKLSTQTLTAALAKHPGHPQLIRRLCGQAQAAANKPRQIELLNSLSPEDPESVLLYVSLARNLFDANDPSARANLDRRLLHAFDLHLTDPELARVASEHFRDTDRPDLAIDILKRHVEAAPASLELRTRLGILHFTAKKDAEGEATLKDVLAIHPHQALAHQALAKFYRLREMSDLARYHASELIKIRGGAPSEFIKLADEWLGAAAPRQARLLLERAVFNHPDNPELANKLAIATRRDPETRERAARLFREAEATRPAGENSGPAFLIESAEALIAQGQSKAAEDRLRTAIKAFAPTDHKETAAALRRLALLWETENRNLDAARALRQRADGLDH